MNRLYYNKYKKYKRKYMNEKSKLNAKNKIHYTQHGGYYNKPNLSDMVINIDCLTEDSIRLINDIRHIRSKYNSLFKKLITKFDAETIKLIDHIRQYIILKRNTFNKHVIKTPLGTVIDNIDMHIYEKKLLEGGENVSFYLKEILNGLNEQYDNSIDLWFMGTDVVKDLKKYGTKLDNILVCKSNNDTIKIPEIVIEDLDYNKLVNEIVMHMDVIQELKKYMFKGKYNKRPVIYLLLSDAKKYMPQRKDDIQTGGGVMITQTSINSAEYGPLTNQLTVFRKEEVSKLLFHEMCHREQIEIYNRVYDVNKKILWAKKWAVNKKNENTLNFNETIVEVFGELVNIIATATLCYDNFKGSFNKIWFMELFFGLYQSAKILYISEFNSNNEFTHPLTTNKAVDTNTNTIEYHIFKTICMLNFSKFYNLYITNNIDGLYNIVYEYSANNKYYNQIIDSLIKEFDTIDKDRFLYKTGRMTIIERNIFN